MVRYSAPHPDDDQTMPMEWTAIPDENGDDEIMISKSFRRFGLGDSSKSRGPHNNFKNVEKDESRQQIICLCESDSQDAADQRSDIRGNSSQGQPEMISTAHEFHNYNPQAMHEEHIQCMGRQLLMEVQWKERRRRRYMLAATMVAFMALILHKYAPPPPPLHMEFSNRSTPVEGSNIRTIIREFAGLQESSYLSEKPTIREHDSWPSYCLDTMQLFTGASLHQLSVFWYAFSNAFVYAAHEIRVASVSYITQFAQPSSRGSEQTTENEQHAFTETWCPIRIPAASNHHFSLPKGANIHPKNIEEGDVATGLSTEEFLRQSIGASISPHNLAISLLSEGIDKWGKGLIESAPVALVHRMSTAVDTGLWIEADINDSSTRQWILPPAMGLLLVGPEGVGKLHTARLLSYWMFSHCSLPISEQDSLCTSSSSINDGHYYTNSGVGQQRTPQNISGVLEILGEDNTFTQLLEKDVHDDDNAAKASIINHLIQRQQQGSVIVLHHIEAFPPELLSELSQVINGKSQHLSYTNSDGTEISASTNGTIFIFTSKQWGTKSIFQEIRKNRMRTIGMHRTSLLSSVRWEVDSHFQYRSKMANVSSPLILFCSHPVIKF